MPYHLRRNPGIEGPAAQSAQGSAGSQGPKGEADPSPQATRSSGFPLGVARQIGRQSGWEKQAGRLLAE